jgi:ATP-dependent DNA helicase UvrD/PcrA
VSATGELTIPQREAIELIDGPLLVIAGPGSGKTRVITRRIAHMIESGIPAREILAITFTNKAAKEMATRVNELVPNRFVWISTFHSFCAHILRDRAEVVGLQSNYTIFDTTDQKQVIRTVMSEMDLDTVHYPPGKISARISQAKNDLISAERFQEIHNESIGHHLQAIVARVYPAYQKALLNANAVDFDDLLLHVVNLLTENPEIREQLDYRFRYVLVDEYQDTNSAQYKIVSALSQLNRNLCVTGDPDQSIYGWRGARIENIMRFEQEFPETSVIRLEQNFRSTKRILQASDELISNNIQRKHKKLFTENPEGDHVQLLHYFDEKQEADGIAERILKIKSKEGYQWSDFAITYRVNALSRPLEFALMRNKIPYQVTAGVAFYDRAEVKDMLAYLRVIYNPKDIVAFHRIVNTPKRGIGKVSARKLIAWANRYNLDPLDAALKADEITTLSKRPQKLLQSFARMMQEFSLTDAGSIESLLRMIIHRTGYTLGLNHSQSEQDIQRLANVEELLTAAKQFDRASEDDISLEGFLETTALASETDQIDDSAGTVTLLTLHASKGLEFPAVFIVGVEQNLLPHERSLAERDPKELEEERRLLFVGMTRAKEKLFLTETVQREFRGRPLHTITSSFLSEMEIEFKDLTQEEFHLPEPILKKKSKLKDSQKEKLSFLPDTHRLTTGADLLSGRKTPVDVPMGFQKGMLVRHPKYGRGTVVDVGGYSKHRTVTVDFEVNDRSETFIASKSHLQPIGRG